MRRLAPALLALALTGCGTSFVDTVTASPSPSPSPSAGATPTPAPVGAADCPAQRRAPDPQRPRVDLAFTLADDLHTVTGTETVDFTPDLPVDQLVFRLVPNGPDTARAGNRLTVDDVRGDDVAGSRVVADGAADPGGLLEVDLDGRLAAGETTRVTLAFTLALGEASFDRVGTDDGVSWWASGAPLLAWEPGVGWARDPFLHTLGETAVSPAADTTVSVSAPASLTVLMTGDQDPPTPERDGRRTWTSAEPAARDVSVAAGTFTTAEAATASGVRVTAGVLDGPADQLARDTAQAITDLEARFGPFPYRTLTVPELPDEGGGIEYPSSILLASPEDVVLFHEVAHMWFYGMVGDSQFRDPWLDEALATFAETVRYPEPVAVAQRLLRVPGDVGGAVDSFASDDQYFAVVYGKGGAALVAARDAAGAEPFDAALRCYVDAQAWTIATPADLARALGDLPAALDVLEQSGALDPEDLPRR